MRRGVLLCALTASCSAKAPPAPLPPASPAGAVADSLQPLRDFEETRRAHTDFAHVPTSDIALGTDPYAIRPNPGAPGFVGILRGRDALVVLDESLHEVARLPAPSSPSGLATAADGSVYVVGELSPRVARYVSVGRELRDEGSFELQGVRGMRDVATGPEGVIYVVEEHDGRLLTVSPRAKGSAAPAVTEAHLCHGPMQVERVAQSVVVNCLLDHTIIVRHVDARGIPLSEAEVRIVRDGPVWGFDAVPAPAGIAIAVGAVENHPLDRTEGSFGFVDSFVANYLVSAPTKSVPARAQLLQDENVSELGIVTPKAVNLWRAADGTLKWTAFGYGAATKAPPGTRMIQRLADGTFVGANPLLDAWVHLGGDVVSVVHVDDDVSRARSIESRLGEALFFTTLMAPWDKSDGRLSRFTCETCHFEGYVDGRIHHTGRGDIVATTKPLLGLFNNRPHFSRALDPDMTTMVHNEFRVAGAKSDHDPWFSIDPREHPWLYELGVTEQQGPVQLRRALMSFLMDFSHRPNPSVVGRMQWRPLEREGAQVFRDHCESCHEARLITSDPSTRVPWDKWESLVMANEGAIVWAEAEYRKTGVVPYVNEQGARVVSLRRLYKKHPYFTNGTAEELTDVVDRAQWQGDAFWHEGAPPGATALTAGEKSALLAFLDLL